MPMHLLLTDVVKHHGGSSELIKILNRVGAVSSEDTHGRLVTFISQQREKEMETEFNPQAFKLASVDNIDVLSQYTKGICRKNVQYMARHVHPVRGVRNDPFLCTRFRNHKISNTDFPISAKISDFTLDFRISADF